MAANDPLANVGTNMWKATVSYARDIVKTELDREIGKTPFRESFSILLERFVCDLPVPRPVNGLIVTCFAA